jgi:hypothetical protein
VYIHSIKLFSHLVTIYAQPCILPQMISLASIKMLPKLKLLPQFLKVGSCSIYQKDHCHHSCCPEKIKTGHKLFFCHNSDRSLSSQLLDTWIGPLVKNLCTSLLFLSNSATVSFLFCFFFLFLINQWCRVHHHNGCGSTTIQ